MNSRLDSVVEYLLDISRVMRKAMAEHGDGECRINMLQLHGLGFIKDKDGITMRELADQLKITPSTVSIFVSRLVRLGLVRRKADTKNRTFIHLHLTPAGEKALRKSTDIKQKYLRELFASVPAADQRHLQRIFQNLSKSLSSRSSH